MKSFLFSLLFLFFTYPAISADYFLSNDGDDNDAGTEAEPWATFTKINESTFLPGDNIYFKRGDTFRGVTGSTWGGFLEPPSSGDSDNDITLGAYGDGDKPKLYGSVDKSSILFG